MHIITANIAGGDAKTHRTIDDAAYRVAHGEDEAYGGIEVVQADDPDAIYALADQIVQDEMDYA